MTGLQPAVAQLNKRQSRFGARLLGLPEGEQAKAVVGATSAIGRRLEAALGYAGRMEEINGRLRNRQRSGRVRGGLEE